MTDIHDILDAPAATFEPDDRPPAFSDEALALRFAEQHKDELRYVAKWGRWLLWDGQRWKFEDTLKAFDMARAVCREVAKTCDKDTLARGIAGAPTVAAVERLAKADRRLAATADQWDADPWLLNTPAGVIDLRTGKDRLHDRGDHITKITAVAPGIGCPTWYDFLDRVTDQDNELQGFLQRMAGYALTGNTREHAMFFLYGPDSNGKSVFINTLSGIAADYATTAPMETFIASRTDRHPTDLAGLRAARLVTATETEEGRRWAESKIKALTGGDKIAARFMRQDFFEFTPQFKLLIAGNHKPGLRNIDEAIRRRLHLVPFTVTIPKGERDKDLSEKLRAEWPGILAWMIEGAIEWHAAGLEPPAAVLAATEEYLAEEDAIERWIRERCTKAPACQALSTALYRDWKEWSEASGEWAGPQKRFSQALEDRGYEKTRQGGSGKIMFVGLAIGAPGADFGRHEDY